MYILSIHPASQGGKIAVKTFSLGGNIEAVRLQKLMIFNRFPQW